MWYGGISVHGNCGGEGLKIVVSDVCV